MTNKILNILEQYDNETKGTLTEDFRQEVLNDKNYTEKEFVEVLINEWTPIWLEDREEDKEVIEKLIEDLKEMI